MFTTRAVISEVFLVVFLTGCDSASSEDNSKGVLFWGCLESEQYCTYELPGNGAQSMYASNSNLYVTDSNTGIWKAYFSDTGLPSWTLIGTPIQSILHSFDALIEAPNNSSLLLVSASTTCCTDVPRLWTFQESEWETVNGMRYKPSSHSDSLFIGARYFFENESNLVGVSSDWRIEGTPHGIWEKVKINTAGSIFSLDSFSGNLWIGTKKDFISEQSLFLGYSTDQGKTWSQENAFMLPQSSDASIHSISGIAFSALNPDHVIVATDGSISRLYVSRDYGRSWEVESAEENCCSKVVTSSSGDGIIILANQDFIFQYESSASRLSQLHRFEDPNEEILDIAIHANGLLILTNKNLHVMRVQ